MKTEDLGSAAISPEGSFPVATTGTWTVTVTVGKHGIDDGGGLIVVQRPMADALPLQTHDPTADGFVSADTDGDAFLRVSFEKRYWIRPCKDAVVVRVFDGSLTPGDTIRIVLGDTGGGGPGWTLQSFPETAHKFHVLVDAFGTREYYPLATPPSIRIEPGPPDRIDGILPSRCRPGDVVPLTLRVSDRWWNPVDTFAGEAVLEGLAEPMRFEITSGVQRVGTIALAEPGVYRLTVRSGDLAGTCSPVWVTESAPVMFWADMHGQTEQTVGTGSVEEYFRFARDKALIDVTAWQGNDFQVTDALWQEVCRCAKRFNEPGRFVAFPGYEWSGLTPQGGDHNILYLKDDQPIHRSSHWQIHDGSSEATDRYPLSELWREFAGRDDVMAIGHVGGRYANLDFWQEGISGLIEVHSHHGTFEWLLHDAIARGLVFGVVGQSDDHSGRPGLSAPLRPLPRDFATFDVFGGYTGIYAEGLDRHTIWDALRARHCFATSGARLILDIRCGDARMGDCVDRDGPVAIAAEIIGTDDLLDVELYRGSERIYRHSLCDDDQDSSWVRIQWSGVRVRSRNKIADWPITIDFEGSRIAEFIAYGFRQADESIERIAPSILEIASRTSGDVRGVFLRLSDMKGQITLFTPHGNFEVAADALRNEPTVFAAGGVNLQVRFSREAPSPRPQEAHFTHQDTTPPKGRTPYWVRVLQKDGHQAWSSPIFVNQG